MCPFAQIWQQGQSVYPEAACNPTPAMEFPPQYAREQPLAVDAASRHDTTSCPLAAAAWPCKCQLEQKHSLTHNNSYDSLVDEVTTVSIPALASSSSGSSSGSSIGSSGRSSGGLATSEHSTMTTSSGSLFTHQHWQLRRPQLNHDPKLTRRQLRRLDTSWTLADVAKHKYCDDGWIAVDGKVYDITEHLVNHPGWDSGCQVSTVLSIIAHLGTDCSEEFRQIHSPYPQAWKQLQAYYIGDLAE